MTKGVKKGLSIFGIVIVLILGLMILIPFMFKGKIKDAVVSMANENLNAEVAIGDFGLNLFSNFPNATLSLDNVSIVGVGDFASDTLLQANSASVTIDLMSLFGDNFDISKINLDGASVYAKLLEDGRANWDIVKEDGTVSSTEEAASSSAFNLKLQDISINGCNIVYEDLQSKMKADIKGWNGNINGDFSASETTLKTHSTIDAITLVMDGIPYMSNVRGVADATVSADFDKMKFTFTQSNCILNDLVASVDGSFAFVGEEGIDFDLKLNAPGADFKQILSLVPAMYTDDFKNVKTSGKASVDAYIMGLMEGDVYPAFDLRVTVSDAMFQYPSLPKSVDNINLILSVNGEGGSLENTIILIDKFSFTLGGNPFKGGLRVTPPLSDANIKFNASGRLDLGMIKDVYPLAPGTELNGKVDADIRVATTMSAIEKEQYEKVAADGHLKLSDMVYKSGDMPDVLINNAALEFTPRYVNLSALDIKIGKSDLNATGRLENFIAYALKDQTLRGQLNVKSTYLNLDELMGTEETVATTAETDERTDDVMIPKNINFALNANFKEVIYDKMEITNLGGAININEGVVSMKNVVASALGGLANINGHYDTSDGKTAKVNFDLALTRVSFAQTFKSVEAIQKFAPIFENLVGTFSMNLKFDTKLGATMTETLQGLTAGGALLTNDVKIENNATLNKLGAALKTDKLSNISPKDLNLPFSVKDGAIQTKPFAINIGDGGMLNLEGSTGLDQTINYKGTVRLPKSLDNKYVSSIPLTIGGSFSDPKVSVDVKAAITDAVSSTVGKLLGGSGEGGDLSAKAAEEKAKQIERIRTEADKTATKIVDTAKAESDKLVAKAGSNKLAQAGAKIAAKKVVDEAQKQAQKLRDAAEEQIKKIEGEPEAAEVTAE